MVQVIIDIPNGDVQRVLDAFCDNEDFRQSGLSQAEYSRQRVIQFIKERVRFYEREKARELAVSGISDVPAS
jgi:hypothetical protein